jgi:hypothetical protein
VSKFKSRAADLRALPELPNVDDVARFAAGAETRSTATTASNAAPWERLAKDDRPHSGVNLRLNGYEHALLKFLAEQDDRSLQQTIKRLLIPAAEAAAEQLRRR